MYVFLNAIYTSFVIRGFIYLFRHDYIADLPDQINCFLSKIGSNTFHEMIMTLCLLRCEKWHLSHNRKLLILYSVHTIIVPDFSTIFPSKSKFKIFDKAFFFMFGVCFVGMIVKDLSIA